MQKAYRVHIHDGLTSVFQMDELEYIFWRLAGHDENLEKSNKQTFAQNLITYFEQRDRLQELINICCELRPRFPWGRTESDDWNWITGLFTKLLPGQFHANLNAMLQQKGLKDEPLHQSAVRFEQWILVITALSLAVRNDINTKEKIENTLIRDRFLDSKDSFAAILSELTGLIVRLGLTKDQFRSELDSSWCKYLDQIVFTEAVYG